MPELPEVETVVRQLRPVVQQNKLVRLRLLDKKLRGVNPAELRHMRVYKVSRAGKQIIFHLHHARKEPERHLAIHLRMTGTLIWQRYAERSGGRKVVPDVSRRNYWRKAADILPQHVRAIFYFEDGCVLFCDPRRFGTFALKADAAGFRPAGLEPLSRAFTRKKLANLLRLSSQEIKPWLLRQDKLCGIGNIYAAEILFAARLHPRRRAGSLGASEVQRLHSATVRILRKAISFCGTTVSDFQDTTGSAGGFSRLLKVYDRENRRCRRCRGAILRIMQQGRSTYYCPVCQT